MPRSLPRVASYFGRPPGRSVPSAGSGRTPRYLFPDAVFRSPGLNIRGIGIRETMSPCLIERPGGTGDFLFMLFHDPAQAGANWRPVNGGQMIFWDRGAAHFYGNPQRRWQHSWIHCDGAAIHAILRGARVRRGEPIVLADPIRIEKYLFDLHEELSSSANPDVIILRNTLENLVRTAIRRGSRRTPIPENLLRCRERIDAHYNQKLTLSDMAAQAGLSVPHFCTEFRCHFGVPPIAYLIARRMQVASTLLRDTAGRIGEIGRQVGYEDAYYFSRHFKALFGLAPSSLRAGFAQE